MFSLVYHECALVLDRGRMGNVDMSYNLDNIFSMVTESHGS